MRRTLNIRVLLILLLVVGIAGAGIYFFHKRQVKQQIDIYLKKAEQAVTDKEPEKAREYLERYLLLQPTNAQALNRYATLLDDSAKSLGEKTRAYLQIEKALRQYATKQGTAEQPPVDLRKRAARLALSLQRFRDATIHLEPLIKASPNDLELKEMLAESNLGLTDTDTAEKLYLEIKSQSPQHLKSYQKLAEIYLQKRDEKKAEDLLKEMVKENSKSIDARLELIKFYRSQNRLSDAARENGIAQQLMESQQLDPNHQARADLLLSSFVLAMDERNKTQDKALAKKKTDEALSYLSQGISQFPKDIRFYIRKAQIELGTGAAGKASALALLRQAIPLVGDDASDQYYVAKLLLDAGEKAEAVKLINGLRSKYGANPILEYFRARLLYDEGKLGEAISIQERIKEDLARNPALAFEADLLLSLAYERVGNPDRRLAALERILKSDATNAQLQVSKADTLVTLGRIAEAVEIYRKQLPSVPAVRFPLIRLLIGLQFNKSVQQRNWSEINSLLNECSADEKKTKDFVMTNFLVLSSTGKQDDLAKAIDQACRDNPREVAYWMAKLNLVNQKPGLDDNARINAIQQVIKDAEAVGGDSPELRLAKAMLAVSLPREKVLSSLEALETNIDKWTPQQQTRLRSGLASVYYSLGFAQDARKQLKKVVEANPSDLAALQAMIELSMEEKDDAEAVRLIEVMRQHEGEEGYRWRLSSLNRLFDKMQGGERSVAIDARKLLNELASVRPGWSQVATAQGRFLELTGQIDQSLEQYKKAIDLGERNPDIIKKTVQLLTSRRRPEEAKIILEKFLDQGANSPFFAKMEAEVTLKASSYSKDVLDKARKAVRSDSKDYRDHLWLGNVLWAAKDKQGAEAALKQALQLGKDAPEAWANWLVYLVKVDRKNEAEAELKRAEAILKDKFTYALTAYYLALDQRDKAEEQYIKLVNSNPNDTALLQSLVGFYFKNGDFSKAELVLKKQLDAALIDANTLAWARRSYALTLAVKGDYASYQQALSLIEQNLKANSISPEDLRTRALVLSTRPGSRDAIIKDLETSFTSLKPSPGEAILLAQVYEDDGNWKKAASILEEMVREEEGRSSRFLAYYVQALVRNKDLKEAEKWLKEMEKSNPNDAELIEPKARFLFARGDKQAAVDLLQNNANRVFSDKKDPSVLFATATLLEQYQEKTAAEKLLRQFVAETSVKAPQTNLALVAFLARQGRTAEAITLCEEISSKLPPGQVAMSMVAALRSGKPAGEQIDRVEKRLRAVSQAEKLDIGVAISLADLMTIQKRTADAEALYRKIIAQDSTNAVALNNLAWLISERPAAEEEAIQLINRAINQAGPVGALIDTRGMIFLRNNKFTEAVKDLTESVQKDPTANHWLHLAYAQYQAKNRADAERSWRKVQQLKLDREQLSAADLQYFNVLSSVFKD